ncbi:MAG: ABC transporter substrate-binding protein, partial [Candidatus Eremiobacteraeota bacterium]|nr:ABC transporter substrate-binding protein [Candidatus Eremiobacteraeota bacterium]
MFLVRPFALACACLMLFATACSQKESSAPAHHGFLRVATYADPSSLNPILATNTGENFLASLAFDFLVTVDDKGNDIPDLAAEVPTVENGGISKDARTITYKLRRGVQWQDGAPFTSADVKFSWQAIMNPQTNVVERRGYDDVASVDTPDDYTVVFHLKKPFSPFVDTVFGESDDGFRVIPRHLLAKYPNLNKVPFNALPIGTGPFKVVQWRRGDRIEYVANPKYFRGKPKLERISVSVVADDNTKTAEIRSHQIDLILDLSSSAYRNLHDVPGIKTVLVEAPSYVSISMNLQHPPLDDVR